VSGFPTPAGSSRGHVVPGIQRNIASTSSSLSQYAERIQNLSSTINCLIYLIICKFERARHTTTSMPLRRKATKVSAGILLYRLYPNGTEVFLVHPGGPFWAKRDLGSWSVPKGEIGGDEDLLEAAKREFREETGTAIEGEFIELAPLRQPSGKIVHVWAVEGEIDATSITSNTFSIEWPPRSGESRAFPEVDRAGWFTLAEARDKLLPGQRALLDQLAQKVSERGTRAPVG
jgi:predicted NUDIX family NTP pyrophosphohydrolase